MKFIHLFIFKSHNLSAAPQSDNIYIRGDRDYEFGFCFISIFRNLLSNKIFRARIPQ